MRKLVTLFLAFILAQTFLYAGVQGTFGTETFAQKDANGNIQQVTYSKIALQPEFSFWKIGVGLDLQAYIDQNGNVRESDWNNWEALANKILYIRYAEKGDPFYLRVGAIDNATIGHGIIFNRYSNMIRYPEVKKVGLIADLNMPSFGIETITTNITREEVMGARLYFKPFYNSGMFLLSDFALGVSGGMDVDPDDNNATKKDEVGVAAIDMELPLLKLPVFSSTLFADSAQMQLGDAYIHPTQYPSPNITSIKKNNGSGSSVGLMGKLLIFNYKVQYKNLESNFVYGYFDRFYEVERSTKVDTLIGNSNLPVREGVYGELSWDIMNKIYIMGSYEDLNNDNTGTYPWAHAELSLDKSLFFNKIFFKCSYDKKHAQNWEIIKNMDGPNTLVRTEMGYALSDSVMVIFVKERTYDANGVPETKTKLETRIVF